MVPDNYVAIYQKEDGKRIFVLITLGHGDFVLTKDCKGEGCLCLGCVLFTATVGDVNNQYPILDLEKKKDISECLTVYPFTPEGGFAIEGYKHKRYKKYKGTISKSQLDKIFRTPEALLFIKEEGNGTFTHSYVSSTIDKRLIAKGCKASKTCPCLGCRIVDMVYVDAKGEVFRIVDVDDARADSDGNLVLPIYSDGEIILSKLLNRNPDIRHEFSHEIFDSPLEQMFYELAFLDLHIYPQHKVGKYRIDFAIPDKKIAIELDGHEYHKTKYQRTHDAQRDRWLFGEGWHVLRFTGTEIYKNLDGCIDEICELCEIERLTKQSSAV